MKREEIIFLSSSFPFSFPFSFLLSFSFPFLALSLLLTPHSLAVARLHSLPSYLGGGKSGKVVGGAAVVVHLLQ